MTKSTVPVSAGAVRTPALSIALAAVASAALAVGCGASSKDVRKAKSSAYDADFALIFETASKVVRGQYPNGADDASQGVIKTSWHVVHGVREEAPPNPGYQPALPGAQSDGSSGSEGLEQRNRMARRNARARQQKTGKNFFVRFDVFVEGKRPFRVRVEGQASEMEQGLTPRKLEGEEEPYWLEERENALLVAIYERLEGFAVPASGSGAPGNQSPQ